MTQKPSAIGPPVTHAEQKELVCDRASHRRQLYWPNCFCSYVHPTQWISEKRFHSYVHHTQFLCGNVGARWPNTNICRAEGVCDCSLIQHGYFLEIVCVVWGHRPHCCLRNRLQFKNPISTLIGLLLIMHLVIKLTFHIKHTICFIAVLWQPGFHSWITSEYNIT